MWHVIHQAVTPGCTVHPGGSVGHTCNLCLQSCLRLSPRLLLAAKAALSCGGGGEGLWLFTPAGLGWGVCGGALESLLWGVL